MKTHLFISAILFLVLSSFTNVPDKEEMVYNENINYNYSEFFNMNETEVDLIIEAWMTDDILWEVKSVDNVDDNCEDESLAIENWMTDDNMWKFSSRN